ncbi:MAG: serine hydrolase domain-containing protein [Desulfobaccales bacterium]
MIKRLLPIIFCFILVLPAFASSEPPKSGPGPAKAGTVSGKEPPKEQVIVIKTAPKDFKGDLFKVGKNGEILVPRSVEGMAQRGAQRGSAQWSQPPTVASAATQTIESPAKKTDEGDETKPEEGKEKKKSGESGWDSSASGVGAAKSSSDFGVDGGGIGLGLGAFSGGGIAPAAAAVAGDIAVADTSTASSGGSGGTNVTNVVPPSIPTTQLQALLNQSVSDAGIPGMVMVVDTQWGTWIGAAGKADLGDAASGRASQPMTVDTQVRLGGVTKLFSAALMMKLVEQGLIKLDDTMDVLLGVGAVPTGPSGEPVTVRMLLNHTSGVHDHETTQEFFAGDNGLLAFPTLAWDPFVNVLPLIESFPLDFLPGSDFKFSNSGYYLLGMVTETVTSSLLEDTIKPLLFDPSGLSHTTLNHSGLFDTASPFARNYCFLGVPQYPSLQDTTDWDLSFDWTSGSGVTTAQDMLTFTQALFGGELVSRDSLGQMTTPQALNTAHGQLTFGYGLEVVNSDPWFGEKVYRSDGETLGAFTRWLYYPDSGRTIFIAMNRCDKRFALDPPLDPPPASPQVDASKQADAILKSASQLLVQAQAQ